MTLHGGLAAMKILGLPWWVVVIGGLVVLKSGILGSTLSNAAGPFQGLVGGGTSGAVTPSQTT